MKAPEGKYALLKGLHNRYPPDILNRLIIHILKRILILLHGHRHIRPHHPAQKKQAGSHGEQTD